MLETMGASKHHGTRATSPRSCSGEPMRLGIGHRVYIASWSAPQKCKIKRAVHPVWVVLVCLVWAVVLVLVFKACQR